MATPGFPGAMWLPTGNPASVSYKAASRSFSKHGDTRQHCSEKHRMKNDYSKWKDFHCTYKQNCCSSDGKFGILGVRQSLGKDVNFPLAFFSLSRKKSTKQWSSSTILMSLIRVLPGPGTPRVEPCLNKHNKDYQWLPTSTRVGNAQPTGCANHFIWLFQGSHRLDSKFSTSTTGSCFKLVI